MSRVENYKPLFAYGILRYPYNISCDGGINIVENAKVSGFKLYAQGGIGIALTEYTGNDSDFVMGTYFEIPEDVILLEYDFIEGYDPAGDYAGNMYNRKMVKVELPNSQIVYANMYVANPIWFHSSFNSDCHIPSGRHEDKIKSLHK